MSETHSEAASAAGGTIKAIAASAAGAPFGPFTFDAGPLGPRQVDVAVAHCGICHSDLSMWKNDWEQTRYPFVAGHEAVGRVRAVGREVTTLAVGQWVGVGWYSGSCLKCRLCMRGDQHLCDASEQTIVERHGGFATRVFCDESWAIALPAGVAPESAGPLFCGGITVFGPIVAFGVLPTMRVGVVGIGGLGHLALQFLAKWGCEVTAFTSSPQKKDEILRLGAHRVVDSRDGAALKKERGRFDFILSTVNVPLDWERYVAALAPCGRLHVVGAVLEPIPVSAFSLIGGQKEISGSPLGSPATVATMLEFCARHQIAPVVESLPMSRANEAFARLESGKARYRIVLANDLD